MPGELAQLPKIPSGGKIGFPLRFTHCLGDRFGLGFGYASVSKPLDKLQGVAKVIVVIALAKLGSKLLSVVAPGGQARAFP